MNAMADTQERYEGIMERREFVQDLYMLLAEHRMVVSEEDRASHMMLTSLSSRLKAALQDVEENADSNITRFSKELAVAIPRLRSEIAVVRNTADDAMIHSTDTPYAEVIPALQALNERVLELVEKANKYMRYQEILRLPVSPTHAYTRHGSAIIVVAYLFACCCCCCCCCWHCSCCYCYCYYDLFAYVLWYRWLRSRMHRSRRSRHSAISRQTWA